MGCHMTNRIPLFLKSMFTLLLSTLFLSSAHSEENLGNWKFNRLLLKPTFQAPEGEDGNFNVDGSFVGVRWNKDESLSAQILLGQMNLRQRPYIYRDGALDTDANELELVEAYGQKSYAGGEFRYGLIPLDFSLLLSSPQEKEDLAPALLYRQGVLVRRDFGLSVSTESPSFVSQLSIHNGEGGPDQDGKLWLTGNWAFLYEKFIVGVTGQAGHTKPIGTTNSSLTLSNFDNSLASKWRIGGLYFSNQFDQLRLRGELIWGGLEQEAIDNAQFNAGHIEAEWQSLGPWGFLMRYDSFDPNEDISLDAMTETIAALLYRDKTDTSAWSLQWIHPDEQGSEIKNDEIRLVWRNSPLLGRVPDHISR